MTSRPGLAQRLAQFADRAAHPGIRFDLGAQKLPRYLVRSAVLVTGFEDPRIWISEKVMGIGINEEELLLDPERYREISFVCCWRTPITHGRNDPNSFSSHYYP